MSATVISASTRVLGSIETVGDLVVEGRVDGSVQANGQLTLGKNAQVSGEISAHDVRIACTLHRAIRAAGIIHLLSTAEVHGDLEAARVTIDDGALFEGQVKLRRAAAEARPSIASTPIASTPISSPASPIAAPSAPVAPARIVPALSSPGRRRLQRRAP